VEVGIYRRVYQRRSKINGEEGRERLKKKKRTIFLEETSLHIRISYSLRRNNLRLP